MKLSLGRFRKPSPLQKAKNSSVTLCDYLIATYAVPVDRVRESLPAGLSPDTLLDTTGERVAFVQVATAYQDQWHWAPLPESSGESFHQVLYRILTRREGKRGVFVLKNFVSTTAARSAQRVFARDIESARFTVHINGDPAHGTYSTYDLRAVAEKSQTRLELNHFTPLSEPPTPFATNREMVEFLTQREELYYPSPLRKTATIRLALEHPPLEPFSGEVVTARLTPFTDTGILTQDELLKPYSVLVQSTLPVTLSPPRSVRLILDVVKGK